MPREKPKSAAYRSFLSCDDPKGVVECKTVRKSKGSEVRKEEMVSRASGHELNCSCSSHLMEVSRGAQKLTQVIDSWSKGIGSSDRKSKDVAKELLKGALDLQESLERLEKLQEEASGFMTKLNKPKEGSGKGKLKKNVGIRGIERTKSERITHDNQKYKLEFGKARHSIDGASWDCYEELRESILDSFAKQNLSTLPTHALEKGSFGRREIEISPDLATTSSSRSSCEKACLDRIRLMSSPDLPSTSSSQSSMFQSQECSSHDSSLPKAQHFKPKVTSLVAKLMGLEEISSGTLKFTSQNHSLPYQRRPKFEIGLPKAKKSTSVDPKPRATQECTRGMQLRSKSIDESMCRTCHPIVSDLGNKFGNGCKPIVLMKPLYAPDLQEERLYSMACPFEENELDKKGMNTKWRRTELREGWSKKHRQAVSCLNDDGITVLGKLSPNRTTNPRKHRLEKKEVVDKRASPNIRKEDMKKVKYMEACKPHDLEKLTSVKLKKQQVVSNISEKVIMWQNSIASDSTLDEEAAFHDSRSRTHVKKNDKPVQSSSVSIGENMVDKKALIDLKPKKETNESENLHFEEISVVSQTSPFDDQSTDENLSCNSMMLTIGSECNEHDQFFINPKLKLESNTTKNFLLSSTPFLTRAEELFHACTWEPVVKPVYLNDEMPDTKVLLDCASELLDNKYTQSKMSSDRLPIRSRACIIPLDKLVAEICDGIDTLISYRDLTTDAPCVDASSALIERDLWCKGAVRRACDLGWREGFTCNEVENVVADMEKLLLSGILEDALDDFAEWY
ncbi:unnamed protein product [Cuscuta epithymum]|uniref:DUF4378 domain-containing protein n=1 Tax=Cuscuta epithymum TaxID=186058 RepID=A0AAV0CLV8_9ASTE|nr:unnamed protein product [Cuscuta epithymum]